MRVRNLNQPAPVDAPTADYRQDDNRELIAPAPLAVKAAFTPFAIEVESEGEARNIAVAMRNHIRYMGHASNSPTINAINTKLQSIDGIEMAVYAEDNSF